LSRIFNFTFCIVILNFDFSIFNFLMVRKTYKKPHRARRKKPLWAKAGFWRAIFMTGAGVFTIWLVCFSPVFEVKEIEIAGAQKIEEREFVDVIEKSVNKKIGLFDSKSILLFNLDQTKRELLARLPQAQEIKIEREFPSKIIASVQERRAAAVFESQGKLYSLDEAGVAFEECADAAGLIKIGGGSAAVDIGAKAIEKEVLNGILRIVSELRASTDIACDEAVIASPERVNLPVKEGWQIYFNPRKDAESQIIRLLAVIKEDSFQEKRDNLEYLDVRFTRVYLKEKNASPAEEEKTEEGIN